MRSIQMVMFMLCVLGGLYLLWYAPSFFLPARGNPAFGLNFDALSARLLGAGLLAAAAAGSIYLRRMYYGAERRLPGPALQRRYFVLLLLALGLIGAAMFNAEPGTDPDRPPPASTLR